MGSRGSVIPFFIDMRSTGELPITDFRMTRFLISLPEAVDTVISAFEEMTGSEVFVRKIPSIKIVDLAKAIGPKCRLKEIGMRPGEKLHEQLISSDEAPHTYEFNRHFKILSPINGWSLCKKRTKGGIKVNESFFYTSDNNPNWLKNAELNEWLRSNDNDS